MDAKRNGKAKLQRRRRFKEKASRRVIWVMKAVRGHPRLLVTWSSLGKQAIEAKRKQGDNCKREVGGQGEALQRRTQDCMVLMQVSFAKEIDWVGEKG